MSNLTGVIDVNDFIEIHEGQVRLKEAKEYTDELVKRIEALKLEQDQREELIKKKEQDLELMRKDNLRDRRRLEKANGYSHSGSSYQTENSSQKEEYTSNSRY